MEENAKICNVKKENMEQYGIIIHALVGKRLTRSTNAAVFSWYQNSRFRKRVRSINVAEEGVK